jgi:MFS family permease
MIGSFLFGVGSLLIFTMVTTMLTEFMPKKSSSGVAVNNFVRNIVSCIASVVAAPLLSGVGHGWTFTILGIIALASSSVIWAMKRYGPKWRKSMDEKRQAM